MTQKTNESVDPFASVLGSSRGIGVAFQSQQKAIEQRQIAIDQEDARINSSTFKFATHLFGKIDNALVPGLHAIESDNDALSNSIVVGALAHAIGIDRKVVLFDGSTANPSVVTNILKWQSFPSQVQVLPLAEGALETADKLKAKAVFINATKFAFTGSAEDMLRDEEFYQQMHSYGLKNGIPVYFTVYAYKMRMALLNEIKELAVSTTKDESMSRSISFNTHGRVNYFHDRSNGELKVHIP